MNSVDTTLPARRAITLIAGREFSVQVRKKSFVVSNILVVLAIVGGIVGYSLFSGDGGPERSTVGLVGDQALSASITAIGDRVGSPVEVREVASADDARSGVAAGDLDVALITSTNGSATAITDSEIDPTLRSVLDAAVSSSAQNRALTERGINPAELAAATSAAVITVDALDPPDPEAGQRTALSFAAALLLFGQILAFGTYVAMGVVEEKSSRVVELLLSTVKPLHLLWGKILGIGAVGLVQLAVYGGAGLAAGIGTGVLTVTGAAIGVFASTLGWFILGFAFFAVLYAAGGSLVSRQEDVNSTTMPMLLLIMVMYFSAFSVIGDIRGTLSETLSWVPPFSAILMPLRIASGVAPVYQIVGTVILMLIATIALAALSARIYQRSILRIGSSVSWKQALSSR